jgi:hypothetical protein
MCEFIILVILISLVMILLGSRECSCDSILTRLEISLSKRGGYCEVVCGIIPTIKNNEINRKLIKFYEEHYV